MWSFLLAGPVFAADDPAAHEEITVYGDPLVELAREAVVRDIANLGYTKVHDRNGRTVFFHDDHWRGKVVFYDDGRLMTKRTGPKLFLPKYFGYCITRPTLCVKAGAWVVSDRKWGNIEDTVASHTAASEVALGDRIADAAVNQTVDALPDRLTALWEQGIPLTGGKPVLVTKAERRKAIYDYWRSRTHTVWGDEVRDAVEGFVDAVVMTSDDPYTEAELAAFDRDADLPPPPVDLASSPTAGP
jgi:hypothetical protein